MKIRDLYKAVLEAVGAVISDDGLVSMSVPGDDPVPMNVNDKRLAMPTDKLLNQGAFNPEGGLIAFHPICENVVLEPSPVLEKLETAMTFKLTYVLRELIMQLTTVAADNKQHKKLKMAAHGLLSALPTADEKTRDVFIKVMEGTSVVGSKRLVSLYTRKGGVYAGEKVSRLGRFFPSIIDHLDEKERTLLGVSLRKADVPAFAALIQYLLPDFRDPDQYAAPSNSQVAPTFQALAKTFAKVAKQLNKIVALHADHLSNAEDLLIDVEWLEAVQDLSKYRELIPVLPGNDGADGTKTAKTAPRPAATTATNFNTAQQAPAPVARSSTGAVSVDDALRAVLPQRGMVGRQQNAWVRQDPEADLPPWARTQQQSQFNAPARGGWGAGGGGTGSL